MNPLGNITQVLSTGALETPVADAPPAFAGGRRIADASRAFQRGTGDEPRGSRGGSIASAQKTSVGGVRPDRAAEDAKQSSDQLFDLVKKGIAVAGDSVKRYLTQDGREQAAFMEACREAMVELAKKEALGAVKKLPFAQIFITTAQLSKVFADAAGEALARANAKLAYDTAVRNVVGAREIDEQTYKQLRYLRSYLANNMGEVDDILRIAFAAVVEKLLTQLFEEAEQAVGAALKNVAGQLAKQLFRQNELLSVLDDFATDQANNIPKVRRNVERAAFHTALDAWVKLYCDKALAGKLAPVLSGIGGSEPVHVAMLAAVLEILLDGSVEQYMRAVPVDDAWKEVRFSLLEAARALLLDARNASVMIKPGEKLSVSSDTVTVPRWLLQDLDSRYLPAAHPRLFRQRCREYEALVARLARAHRALHAEFQREVFRADRRARRQASYYEIKDRIIRQRQDQLERASQEAAKIAEKFVARVREEFGRNYDEEIRVYLLPVNPKDEWNREFPIGLAPYANDD
jgi:hypothetical protein